MILLNYKILVFIFLILILAHQLRIHSIEMTIASNSGHPTSCASMAEIMAALFFTKAGLHLNPKDPAV